MIVLAGLMMLATVGSAWAGEPPPNNPPPPCIGQGFPGCSGPGGSQPRGDLEAV
jgi:hypothetical protein